jgi:hypothetical protein
MSHRRSRSRDAGNRCRSAGRPGGNGRRTATVRRRVVRSGQQHPTPEGWAPNVVGTYGTTSDVSDTLNTIALVNGNCQDAYIGGKFTSVNASGMEGLDPANGNLYVTPDGSVGYYSRDRGLGADDMLVTSAGLWIASDNLDDSQMCGGVENLSGICFLPYSN